MSFPKKVVGVKKSKPTMVEAIGQEQAEVALATAKKLTEKPDATLNALTTLELDLTGRIGAVRTELSTSLKQVAELDQAIVLKKDELAKWGEVKDLTLMLDELRSTIDATKAQWATDKEAHEAAVALEAQERSAARAHEEKLYTVSRDSQRAEEQATYDAQRKALKLKHADEDLVRDRAHQAREAALKAREEELANLQKQVAAFPTQLEKAVKDAVGQNTGILTAQFRHTQELAAKDSSTAKTLADAQIRNLTDSVAAKDRTIATLETRLEAADRKVENMALEVAKAASGKLALDTLQQDRANQGQQNLGQNKR